MEGIPLTGCLHGLTPCLDHTKCFAPYRGMLCDGKYDCPDGSDESNCTLCKGQNNVWFIKQNMCAATKFLCDGYKNIPDGADEINCAVCPKVRPFKCGSNSTKCIHKGQVCNSKADCPDDSDELNCTE